MLVLLERRLEVCFVLLRCWVATCTATWRSSNSALALPFRNRRNKRQSGVLEDAIQKLVVQPGRLLGSFSMRRDYKHAAKLSTSHAPPASCFYGPILDRLRRLLRASWHGRAIYFCFLATCLLSYYLLARENIMAGCWMVAVIITIIRITEVIVWSY